MADIPSFEQAEKSLKDMVGGAIGNPNVAVQYHTTLMSAAAGRDMTDKVMVAAANLTEAVYKLAQMQDKAAAASDRGTKELSKWSETTARWTKGLVLATWALFTAMVVQIMVMLFR